MCRRRGKVQWRLTKLCLVYRAQQALHLRCHTKRPALNVREKTTSLLWPFLTDGSATDRNERLIAILKDLRGRVDDEDRSRIEFALNIDVR